MRRLLQILRALFRDDNRLLILWYFMVFYGILGFDGGYQDGGTEHADSRNLWKFVIHLPQATVCYNPKGDKPLEKNSYNTHHHS
jgi:hypothetical protein